ncbi:MAG: hypothetical protein CL478_11975 [Acidobacteria bacterium]|nr:hypothetical protein [Acidobacteriota bacterium]
MKPMKNAPEETNANQPQCLAKRIGWVVSLLALVAAVLFGWFTERDSLARRSNHQAGVRLCSQSGAIQGLCLIGELPELPPIRI